MSAVMIPAPQQQELGQQVSTWTELAQQLAVTDHGTFGQAGRYLLAIKQLQVQADETFDPIIRKAHEAHKEALTQKKRICDPLDRAADALKGKMGAYTIEERRLRDEEERRLQAEAERAAAEQREAEIEEAEAAGATREEVEVIAQAPLEVAPVMRQAAPKISGVTARETWRAEVTDLLSLVRFIDKNPQFVNLVQPNTVAVGQMARTLRSAMKVPGVRAWKEPTIAVRGRA